MNNINTSPLSKADWLIPAALITLAFIPILAGLVRLGSLASGAATTSENARFFASPVPVILHIIGATTFCILGAVQFSPGLRARYPKWHRASGRIVVVAGLLAALAGLWMAQLYAIVPADNMLLHAFRLFFGAAMLTCIVLGFTTIRNGQVILHQAWMRRAYAIGQGAGTQAVTQLPMLLIYGKPDAMTLAMMMGGAWVLNLTVAEWFIKRQKTRLRYSAVARSIVLNY
jgi:uncharacterized membrane protein